MPLQSIKPVVRNTVVTAVTDQLRTQILSGAFVPGVRLPPERELAERLGVNRLTLRAALSRLETLGLIQTQHGTGSMVRDYREHGGVESLPNLLHAAREGDAAVYFSLARDLLDLRRGFACETVAFAAERHDARDIKAMRAVIVAQADRVGNTMAFARGDMDFARVVVRAARNVALELLLNTFVRLPEENPGLAREMYPNPRAQHAHYDVVIALIESRDGDRARSTMRVALEAIDRITLARIKRGRAKLAKGGGRE